MGKLLEIHHLTKKYQEGNEENNVIDHIDFDIEEGDFVIFMGASGSGKTSLLHLMAGIDDSHEGTIKYKDVNFGQMSEKEKTVFRRTNLGIVFQNQCLVPDLTVYENIMLPIMLNKNRKKSNDTREHILNLCNRFNLAEHIRKYPSQLSGGQQQRVAILRAIANNPSLLLCDEPTGSLNSAHSDGVMELLSELNQKGQTIILVTHDIKVATVGKRVVFIKDGTIGGELRFSDQNQKASKDKEEELFMFLKKRGW